MVRSGEFAQRLDLVVLLVAASMRPAIDVDASSERPGTCVHAEQFPTNKNSEKQVFLMRFVVRT